MHYKRMFFIKNFYQKNLLNVINMDWLRTQKSLEMAPTQNFFSSYKLKLVN